MDYCDRDKNHYQNLYSGDSVTVAEGWVALTTAFDGDGIAMLTPVSGWINFNWPYFCQVVATQVGDNEILTGLS